LDLDSLVKAVIPYVKNWRVLGLATTVQHTHQLQEAANLLEQHGFNVFIGLGSEKTRENGQVLGCYYHSVISLESKVEGYLFIGGGKFHPMGLAISTKKPIVIANPFSGAVTYLDEGEIRKLARKRYADILSAKNSKKLGIIVSLKPGQYAFMLAEVLVEKFVKKGYEAFILALNDVRAENLNNFIEVEAFINTACPRISINGVEGINRPILTMSEAHVILGEAEWKDVWGAKYLSYDPSVGINTN
jgi:2-(3-amino-3-carboxypropyl)histidine synthase